MCSQTVSQYSLHILFFCLFVCFSGGGGGNYSGREQDKDLLSIPCDSMIFDIKKFLTVSLHFLFDQSCVEAQFQPETETA